MSHFLVREIFPPQLMGYQTPPYHLSLIKESCFRHHEGLYKVGYEIVGADLPSPKYNEIDFVSELECLLEEIFENYPSIKELHFKDCDFFLMSGSSSKKIATILSRLPCESIEFTECLIDFSDFEKLVESRHLKSLIFNKMTFDEVIGEQLVYCLNFSLQKLGFVDCKIDNLNFIEECRQKGIQDIFFTNCSDITVNGIRDLARLFNENRIEYLLNTPETSKMRLHFRFNKDDSTWTGTRMAMMETLFARFQDMIVTIGCFHEDL